MWRRGLSKGEALLGSLVRSSDCQSKAGYIDNHAVK